MANNTSDTQSTVHAYTLRAQLRVTRLNLVLDALDGLEVLDGLDLELYNRKSVFEGKLYVQRRNTPAVASSSATTSAHG